MAYEAELQFLQRILKQMSVPFLVVPADARALHSLDMGLRETLGLAEESVADWTSRMGRSLREKTLFYITDEFYCRYAAVYLPQGKRGEVLVIGPYTSENVDRLWLDGFMAQGELHADWLPVLENFYHQVRYLENESILFAALQALAEHMWGPGQYTTERIEQGVPESWLPLKAPPDPKVRDGVLSRVRLIEQRYEAENRLMELVRRGRGQKVQMMLSQFSRAALERRGELTRDVKNYSIILNTLMRKAAEQGGVHPMYIDRVSSDFARQIEKTGSWEAFMTLWGEMARTYCLLVRKHMTKDLSPTIQKVVLRIDSDLTADLGLKATAKVFNVNPSYLSSLFKKETGETLTSYVNRKRMEHAAYLLSSTQMNVSAVAQSCGISDDNYFTKLFKRSNGVTPVQFRRDQKHFPK